MSEELPQAIKIHAPSNQFSTENSLTYSILSGIDTVLLLKFWLRVCENAVFSAMSLI